MNWSAKYIQESLFYEPWKTKFIEVFSREYPILVKNYKNTKNNDKAALYINASIFNSVFETAIKILKKKLLCDGCTDLKFNSDILYEAYKKQLITDINIWFDAIDFVSKCVNDNAYCKNFKPEYLNILEEFKNKIKPLVKNQGFRDRDYVFYDNTPVLWGIKERFYKKIIELFLDFEDLKIVRIAGSRVTQNYREFSDIDLISEGTYDKQTFDKIYDELHNLELPYIIDMNDILQKSQPFIYRNVVRSNLFYARQLYYPEDSYVSVLG